MGDPNTNIQTYAGIITIAITEAPVPPSDFFLNGGSTVTIREDQTVVMQTNLLC